MKPTDSVATLIRQLAPTLRIAHHVRGRIRLKLLTDVAALTGTGLPPLAEIEAQLATIPGIRSVRINALARSCTVEYDETAIPPDTWRDLLSAHPTPAGEALVRAVRRKYDALAED